MSLILPIAQITSRSGLDPAARTGDGALAEGAPFRQELIQALGLLGTDPASPELVGSGRPPQEGTAERLDPLGAALRALLGGEPTSVTPAEADPLVEEGERPEEPAPADPAPELTLAADLAGALVQSAEAPMLPVAPEPMVLQPSTATASANLQPVVQSAPQPVPTDTLPLDDLTLAQPVVEGVAETVPVEPPADPESEPMPDSPNAEATRVTTAKAPTFDDLVDLITGAQASDSVRHTAKQTTAVVQPTQESPAKLTTQSETAPVLDALPEPTGLFELRSDGPKPAFAQALPTPVEPGPARALPIPAPALLNQVTRSIRLLAEGARSELHVKLHPAELGEVLVRLTIQDGVLHAHLQTSDAAVKATLDANLDALKVRFEQQGLQVSSLAVSTGAGQLTDDGQARSGWTQESGKRSGQSDPDSEGDQPQDQAEAAPPRRILGRRWGSRLDSLA